MITVSLNLGRTPSVLRALQDPRLAARAAKAAAQEYHEAILDWIRMGKSFTSRTDQLKQSIGWRPKGGGAVVYATAEHALYIEEGTGLHGPRGQRYVIRPKPGGGRKALAIPMPGGGHLLRKLANHPGIQAKPFFFADFKAREDKMLDEARSVLAEVIAHG
jgi:hypothetical protein